MTTRTIQATDEASTRQELSAMPIKAKEFRSHLGITIEWSGPPPSYLLVTIGGGAAAGRAQAADRPFAVGGGVRC